MTKDSIIKKLKTVLDPELGINIVDLGLIYDVKINKNKVRIKLTLTTPGCPLSPYFARSIEEAVLKVKGVDDVQIDLTFEPPWTPEKMTEEARVTLGIGI